MSSDPTPVEDDAPENVPEATEVASPVAAEEPAVAPPAAVEEPAVEEPAVEEPAVDAPEADSSIPEITLGQGDIAEPEVDPNYVPVMRGKLDRFGVAMGTGRRKTSVARVRLKEGSGEFKVNGRAFDTYFVVERDREMIQAPLKLVDRLGKVDVTVRVSGGGTTGQTGAVILGIARALQAVDPSFHHKLADAGFLTRDSRMVERKKYGLRKARRSFQFSKR